MNQIGSMFLVGTMGILGGIPTLYILISLPVILVQKIFGKIKYDTGNPCISREKVREGCLKRAAFLWYETPLAH